MVSSHGLQSEILQAESRASTHNSAMIEQCGVSRTGAGPRESDDRHGYHQCPGARTEKGGNLRYATRHCHDGLARSACHASIACASCGGRLMQAEHGAASAALVDIGLWTGLYA